MKNYLVRTGHDLVHVASDRPVIHTDGPLTFYASDEVVAVFAEWLWFGDSDHVHTLADY